MIVLLGTLGAASLSSIPASAADGVLEINQTCAVITGCFTGDSPGYPVTIPLTGRSFVLTSRLFVPDENTSAIVVSVVDVSIDLNGYEIDGPVACAGLPLVCTPASGTGSGVEVVSTFDDVGVSVKNGSITGMGHSGVRLGDQAEVSNLRARGNRVSGINVSNGSTVSSSTAYQNGSSGVVAGIGSTISGNTAQRNAVVGLLAGAGSTLSGNTAYENGNHGISAGNGVTVLGNAAFQNGGNGIQVDAGAVVSGNSVYDNDVTGIRTDSGATVLGNSVRANSSFGLFLGADSGYRENVISSNSAGTVGGTSLVNLGNNACNGSTTCP